MDKKRWTIGLGQEAHKIQRDDLDLFKDEESDAPADTVAISGQCVEVPAGNLELLVEAREKEASARVLAGVGKLTRTSDQAQALERQRAALAMAQAQHVINPRGAMSCSSACTASAGFELFKSRIAEVEARRTERCRCPPGQREPSYFDWRCLNCKRPLA